MAATASVALATLVASPASAVIEDGTEFYVPKPNHDAVRQIAELTSQGNKTVANKLRTVINTATGVWVEGGSAKEAEQQVRQVTRQAAGKDQVPLLVLYNIPFRDCAQYSAGGATSVEEYKAWIDAVAAGIGDREVAIALEPDGLGIIPWYTTVNGNMEWCQPAEADPDTAAADRFEMLNYAVDVLGALGNTSVYLDATHSGWLGVGDIADRLLKAGIEDADGFFLNASNYQWTENLVQYGTWISQCLAYVTEVNPGGFGECGNQYWSGGPANGWQGVALDASKIWSDTAADPTANTAGINSRYDLILGDVEPPRISSSTPAATARVRGPRPARLRRGRTRRPGATRRTAVSASGRRRTPATSSSTPTCGSRSPASRTASAAAVSAAATTSSTRSGVRSTRTRASGSPSRLSSWFAWRTSRCRSRPGTAASRRDLVSSSEAGWGDAPAGLRVCAGTDVVPSLSQVDVIRRARRVGPTCERDTSGRCTG